MRSIFLNPSFAPVDMTITTIDKASVALETFEGGKFTIHTADGELVSSFGVTAFHSIVAAR